MQTDLSSLLQAQTTFLSVSLPIQALARLKRENDGKFVYQTTETQPEAFFIPNVAQIVLANTENNPIVRGAVASLEPILPVDGGIAEPGATIPVDGMLKFAPPTTRHFEHCRSPPSPPEFPSASAQ